MARRRVNDPDITIASGSNTSDSFDMGPYAGGTLFLPSGLSGVIFFEVSYGEGDTPVPFYDKDKVEVYQELPANPLTTNVAMELPHSLFSGLNVRLVMYDDTVKTAAENQGGPRSIKVILKS